MDSTANGPPCVLYIGKGKSFGDNLKLEFLDRKIHVEIECSGEKGLAAQAAQPSNLVLIDDQLPDMSGIDVTRKLLSGDPYLPTVLMTQPGNEQIAAEALALGVYSYVVKDDAQRYTKVLPQIIKSALLRAAEHQAKVRAEAHLDNILGLAPETIIVTDDKFVIQLFNRGAERVFGYAQRDILGKSLNVLLPDRFQGSHDKHMAGFSRSDSDRLAMGERSEIWGLRKDGSEFPAEASVSRFEVDGKRTFTVMLREITERKRAEAKIQEAEAQFRNFFNLPLVGSAIYQTRDKKWISINDAFCEMLGYSRDELMKLTWLELTHPDDLEENIRLFNLAISDDSDGSYSMEKRYIRKDGEVVYAIIYAQCIQASNGKAAYSLLSVRDITDLKKIEIASFETRASFQAIVDSSPAAITLKDRNHRFLIANRAFISWMGIDVTEIIGKTVHELFPQAEALVIEAADTKVINEDTENLVEASRSFRDGKIRQIVSHKTPIHSADGEVVAVSTILTDITPVKEASEALYQSEARLRSLIDGSPFPVFLKNLDGRFETVNKPFEEWYGINPDEIIGKTSEEYFPASDAENYVAHDQQVMQSMEVTQREDQMDFADGSVHQILITKFPIRDIQGELTGIGTINTDITEYHRVQSELRYALEQAKEASNVKSEFLANMSHELRTPLNAIIGFSDMIGNQYLGPIGNDQYAEYAHNIESSGRHLMDLVNDILDVERIEAGKYDIVMTNVDVRGVFDECYKILDVRAQQGSVTIQMSVPDDLPSIHADRRALLQILINLGANAIKFTPDGGLIRMTARAANLQHTFEVKDTGIGIAKEDIPGLVNPFSRHQSDPHKSQDGVGLGLSISNSLVELHRGKLVIESELGKGTSVRVTMPSCAP